MATRESKTGISADELKASELYGIVIRALGENADLDDTVIMQKLYAAEDFYERDLQLFWNPRRVFSDVYGRQAGIFPGANSLGLLPVDFDEVEDVSEPAYNYDTDLWGEERWGHMSLNWRPVRSITKFFFAYPGVEPIYSVPPTWVRLDQKFGHIQLVPSSTTAIFATFNAYFLGVIAGGRGLPQSIYVDYTAGFTPEELQRDHQDLLEGVRLRTLLNIIGIAGTAVAGARSGGSLGLDGLSESTQFGGGKFGPYSGRIELAMDREKEIRETWNREGRGINMVVV